MSVCRGHELANALYLRKATSLPMLTVYHEKYKTTTGDKQPGVLVNKPGVDEQQGLVRTRAKTDGE